jgi:hypothetical protein
MRIKLLIIQLILSGFILNLSAVEVAPKVVKGVLDLRNISNRDQFTVALNGEWEFYWRKMFRPADFKAASPKPDYF